MGAVSFFTTDKQHLKARLLQGNTGFVHTLICYQIIDYRNYSFFQVKIFRLMCFDATKNSKVASCSMIVNIFLGKKIEGINGNNF